MLEEMPTAKLDQHGDQPHSRSTRIFLDDDTTRRGRTRSPISECWGFDQEILDLFMQAGAAMAGCSSIVCLGAVLV